MRTFIAFLLAPILVAALVPMAIEQSARPYPIGFLLWSLPAVYVFTLVVSVPLYALLPRSYKHKLWSVIAAASLSSVLSFAALNIPPKATHAQVGPTVQIRDGAYTAEGWINLCQQAAFIGLAGALGGICFFLIANRQGPKE